MTTTPDDAVTPAAAAPAPGAAADPAAPTAGADTAAAGRRRLLRRSEPRNPQAAMTLVEHLRELRNRLVKAAIAIAIGTLIGWIFYDRLFELIIHPFDQVIAQARAEGRTVILALNGVTDAFTLKLKVSVVMGLMLAAPVWLYQLWRFIAPGLVGKEKRWAYGFAATATPLFLAGVALGYVVLPRLLTALLNFTPTGIDNIISIDFYLNFFLQLLIFFGISFLIPLVFVMLNFAGLLSGARLRSWWRGIIFGAFLFAAVATPSGDPINMTVVAVPMLVLMALAVAITLLNDRRRARKRPAREQFEDWDDEQVSPLGEQVHDPADDLPTPIDDPVPGVLDDSTR